MKIIEIFAVLLLVGGFRSSLQIEDGLDTSFTDVSISLKEYPEDCSEYQLKGYISGYYPVHPLLAFDEIKVYCDFESYGGKWTLIQQRTGDNEAFDVDFETYKKGFNMNNGNLWVGLNSLHELTKNKKYELLIELTDRNNVKTTANYKVFRVGPEWDGFDLHIGNYTGTADNILAEHNLKQFTSSDSSPSDIGGSCVAFKGGWWGDTCKNSNLNRINLLEGSLIKGTRMMIRPLIAMDPDETCATKLQMSGLSDSVTELHTCSCNQNREELKKLSELTSTLNNNNFVYLENRFKDVEETIDSLNLNETLLENKKRINDVENNIISTLSGELNKRFIEIEHTSSSNNKDVSKRLSGLTDANNQRNKEIADRFDDINKSIKQLDVKDVVRKQGERLEEVEKNISKIIAAELDRRFGQLNAVVEGNWNLNRKVDGIQDNLARIVTAELDKRFRETKIENERNYNNLNQKLNAVTNIVSKIYDNTELEEGLVVW